MVTQTKKRTHDQLNEVSGVPELHRTLLVANLPKKTNEESVKKLLAPIVATNVQVRNSRGKITAVIELSSTENADKALASLNNKEVEKRTLKVSKPTNFDNPDPSDSLLFVFPSDSVPTEEQAKSTFKNVKRMNNSPSLFPGKTNVYIQFETVDDATVGLKGYSGSIGNSKSLVATYVKPKAAKPPQPKAQKKPKADTPKPNKAETPAKKQKTENAKTTTPAKTENAKTTTPAKSANTPAKAANTPAKATNTPAKATKTEAKGTTPAKTETAKTTTPAKATGTPAKAANTPAKKNTPAKTTTPAKSTPKATPKKN